VTQWVVLGYLVPAIVLALPGGRWLDRVPARWALTFSVVLITVSMRPSPGAGRWPW
jgi:MFS family permease